MSKGLEALKRITLKDFILNNDSCLKDIKIIEKELKALEIIKNKKVDIKDIYKYADYSQYNYAMLGVPYEFRLTIEEYDLLKEVLL